MIHKFTGVMLDNGRETTAIPSIVYSEVPAVYEIIRVIDRTPLFLSEHLDRLRSSCEKSHLPLEISKEEIKGLVEKVISINVYGCRNVKILCKPQDGVTHMVVGFVESRYPGDDIHERGAYVRLHRIERTNPDIKMENSSYVSSLNDMLARYDINEVLIVNNDGYITEGGRSNVFFVKDNVVYIPKKKESLMGITQMQTLSVLESEDVKIREQKISIADMEDMDGLFLTGTSIDVFPITRVDDLTFDSVNNPIIKNTARLYRSLMESNISSYTWNR